MTIWHILLAAGYVLTLAAILAALMTAAGFDPFHDRPND